MSREVIIKAVDAKDKATGIAFVKIVSGRSVLAKVFHPNAKRAEYQIEKGGIASYRDSLPGALELVRERYEDALNAMGIESISVRLVVA